MITYPNHQFLVETDWLAMNLNNANLRIFDCAAQPNPNPDEFQRKKYPLSPKSARNLYDDKHIPGAGYIDVPNDLTDQSSEIPMMLAPIDQLISTFAQAGISNDNHVILYSSTSGMWATRVWYVLRSLGFNKVSVLNGSIEKWIAEQRPVSTGPSTYSLGTFNSKIQTDMFVDKERVLSSIKDSNELIIHALTPSVYDGSNDALIFGRRGHIPSSINIPSGAVLDPDSGIYLPSTSLQKLFKDMGCNTDKKIIIYCGGGVNATMLAFAFILLGYHNVSVYDGSMCEWGNDKTLPIEI